MRYNEQMTIYCCLWHADLFTGSDPDQGQEPSRLDADDDTQSCDKVHEGRVQQWLILA